MAWPRHALTLRWEGQGWMTASIDGTACRLCLCEFVPPSPPIDGIWAVMIVWRSRGKIIRTAPCCVLYNSFAQHAHPFNGPLSRTTWAGTRKEKTIWILLNQETVSGNGWHQLGHMQVCTSLQTDNHASTPPLSFLQAGCPSCRPTNSVKALKAKSFEQWCAHKYEQFLNLYVVIYRQVICIICIFFVSIDHFGFVLSQFCWV